MGDAMGFYLRKILWAGTVKKYMGYSLLISLTLCFGCSSNYKKEYQSSFGRNIQNNQFVSSDTDQPEIVLQTGHTGSISVMDISADGKLLVSGSWDKTIKIWDLQDRKVLRVLRGHTEEVSTVDLSPDGKYIVSGAWDGTIRIWDVKTGQQIKVLVGDSPERVRSVVFTQDGKNIISGGDDNKIRIWDVVSGNLLKEIGGIFSGHDESVRSIVISNDNKYFLSGGSDGKVILWDRNTNKQIHTFKSDKNSFGDLSGVTSVSFSPDGNLIACTSQKVIKLWNIETKKLLHRFDSSDSKSIVFSPDGRYLLSIGKPTAPWDLNTGSKKWEVSSKEFGFEMIPHTGIFSPDGKYIYIVGIGGGNSFLQIDANSKKLVQIFGQDNVRYLNTLAIGRDGQYLVSAGMNGFMRLWDIYKMKGLQLIPGHAQFVSNVIFTPDNKYIVSSSGTFGEQHHSVRVWDVKYEKLSHDIKLDHEIGAVSINPDSKNIAISVKTGDSYDDPSKIEIRNFKTGKIIKTITNTSPPVNYSPDGNYLLAGCREGRLCLFDVRSGKMIRNYGSDTWLPSTVFSPDGKRFIAPYRFKYSGINSFCTLNTRTGELSKVFSGHLSWPNSFAYSPDKQYVVSGGRDSTVRLWNARTGEQLKIFFGHNEDVKKVLITPDSKHIISGSTDGTIKIWDIESNRLLVTMISLLEDNWIIITPEGYYDASPGADKYLAVRIDNKVYGIDQYRDTFYRPEIVQAALTGKALPGLVTLNDIKPAPNVALVDAPAKVDRDEVSLKVRITDDGGGVGNIRVYVDGTAMSQRAAQDIMSRPAEAGGRLYTFPVKLTAGKHQIKVVAFNADNTMRGVEVVHDIEALVLKVRPTLHALLIGIDDYDNPKLNLNYAAADAELMEQTLKARSPGYYQGRLQIQRLTTKAQTSKAAILSALRKYQSTVKPDDVFLFFVAAHGIVDKGKYYLISSNVDAISHHILKRNAISQDDLKQVIANIPASKKIVLIDTCNAGKLGKELQVALLTRGGLSEETALKLLGESVGSVLLSASTSQQQALEGYKGQGLFTYVVAEGMNGAADDNNDQYVFTDELVGYVDAKVRKLSEQHFRQKQFPTTGLDGNMFPLTQAR